MVELPDGLLTFCMTDIEGSTALWDQHPELMSNSLARHTSIIRAVIEAERGCLVQAQGEGDSTLSVFVHPGAAVRASEAIHASLEREPWPAGISIKVRIGLHTGEAELRDGVYYGAALSRAARVRAVAAGGQTMLSRATAELVRDGLPEGRALRLLGAWDLKGFARSEEIHCLVGSDGSTQIDLPHNPATRALPGNLPALLSRFIGRESELTELGTALATSRLVTVTGPGGSGKTRIAIEAARRRIAETRDGVWFVDLAPLEDAAALPGSVARALDVADEEAAAGANSDDPLDRLCYRLRASQRFVVLDNCEHLAEPCALLAGRVLTAAPDISILATSQRPLGLDGEQVVELPPLALVAGSKQDLDRNPPTAAAVASSDAVAFLVDRARATGSSLQLTEDNASDLVALCAALDCMPLALELAAAHLRHLSPAEVLSRLGADRFGVLRRSGPTTAERHRTMVAAVDWSYDLLDERDRELLQRLAVFSGGFTLEAAERVCVDDQMSVADVYDGLASLVATSFIARRQQGSSTRFWLLETIRHYGWQRLLAPALPPAVLPTQPVSAAPRVLATLRRAGRLWTLTWDGGTDHLPGSKGLDYLSTLLRTPGIEHLAVNLARGAAVSAPARGTDRLESGHVGTGDAGPLLDDAAIAAYRHRVRDLRREIDEAVELGHCELRDRLEAELAALTRELARGVGLDGRPRTAGSETERARTSVTKALKSALQRLTEIAPEVGLHLRESIRTGVYCSYQPPPSAVVTSL